MLLIRVVNKKYLVNASTRILSALDHTSESFHVLGFRSVSGGVKNQRFVEIVVRKILELCNSLGVFSWRVKCEFFMSK